MAQESLQVQEGTRSCILLQYHMLMATCYSFCQVLSFVQGIAVCTRTNDNLCCLDFYWLKVGFTSWGILFILTPTALLTIIQGNTMSYVERKPRQLSRILVIEY